MLPEKEFNALLVKFTPYVRSQIMRRCPVDLVEDAVQDVLLDACAKRANYDPARGAFVTWLYWLIRNRLQVRAAYAHKRRHISHTPELYEDGDPITPAIAIEGDPHAHLELSEALDAVRTLKPKQAEAIMQRAIGVTFDEIGKSFGASAQYAQQLHHAGMAKLRKRTGRKPQLYARTA